MGLLGRSKNKENKHNNMLRPRITHYVLRNAGFTLVELIVVFSIIAVLTAVFLVNFRAGSEQSRIELIAQNLVSEIRTAQSNTLGAVKYEGTVPEGGWGVHLEEGTSQYTIFADTDADFEYDDPGETSSVKSFEENVSILSVDGVDSVDIVFEPPDPTTYINGTSTGEVLITLADDRNNNEVVRVNFFGLIEVVD